jgi:L-threonylcarbamoyladenylate synthase
LKRRGAGKPLPVIVSDEAMAREIAAEVPQAFEVLGREFWPGPLTLVLKAKSIFPGELYGPGQTIGLRVPAAVWARELVCFLKIPITATSANLSGRKEVSDPAEIQRLFGGLVDLIIDGGKTSGGRPSTVIDLTASEFKILREGAIRRVDIQKALGRLT